MLLRIHDVLAPAIALLLLVGLAAARPASGQIYQGHSPDGVGVVLSNHASSTTPDLLVAEVQPGAGDGPPPTPSATAAAPSRPAPRLPLPPPWVAPLVRHQAHEHGVPEELVWAVMAVESAFNPTAKSPRGASGLMQLMPATAVRFGATDIWEPAQNVRAGVKYLRWLLDRFGGNVELALAGYNAGEGAVQRAGLRVPAIAETQAYVPRVMAWLRHYAVGRPGPNWGRPLPSPAGSKAPT